MEHRKPVNRPSWDDYFMGIAFVVSERSEDFNTHHGCVLVDENNHIIATGYNSFCGKIDNTNLPNTRPAKGQENDIYSNKYIWMKHSEKNALANTTKDLWGCTATAYITGKPCFECLSDLWQFNVRRIIFADTFGWKRDCEENERWDEFIKRSGIDVIAYNPNLSWLKKVLERVETLGFIDD